MRTGLFEHWQREYADRGIVTFPVRPDKSPAIRAYQNVGSKASRELASKFPDATAIGVLCRRNRFTVLDIDTPDEQVLADALKAFGPTPFVVRTGSGNHQGWYRHNGETRQIRPDPCLPIDILGDGYVVGPHSQTQAGTYQIIEGMLDNLANLPAMRVQAPKPATAGPRILKGQRGNDLFHYCLEVAGNVRTLDDLAALAITHNLDAYTECLPDHEVRKTAASAWRYQVDGRNFVGRGRRVYLPFDAVDQLAQENPNVLALYCHLQRQHSGRGTFFLASAMAASPGWDVRAFRRARDTLIERGLICRVSAGGRGPHDPPVFRFGKGYENALQS